MGKDSMLCKNIGITQVIYYDKAQLETAAFVHKDARIMDQLSKYAFITAEALYKKVFAECIAPEKLACVLCTTTGAVQAVINYHAVLNERGYTGLNPSEFPNVMLSTQLARCLIPLNIQGPSVALYLQHINIYQGLVYGLSQIQNGHCTTVLVLSIQEHTGCFGLVLEEEHEAERRGLKSRFILEKIKHLK
jgi:hypothetical protein